MNAWRKFKHGLASWLLDAPRYGLPLRRPRLAACFGRSWVDLRNRHEQVLRRCGQGGLAVDQDWTSELFYCHLYPRWVSNFYAARWRIGRSSWRPCAPRQWLRRSFPLSSAIEVRPAFPTF